MKRAIAIVLLAAAPGCFWVTTKSEGKALRSDVDQLNTRVSKKEGDLDTKVAELQKAIDDAKKLLGRNSADLGTHLDSLDQQQREAVGLITAAQSAAEDVRQGLEKYKAANDERIAALEARVAALERGAAKKPARRVATKKKSQ